MARPTTVLLIRHGATPTTGRVLPGRAGGLGLSAAGHEQAESAAERLRSVKVAAVYASPLRRTRETAAPIAAATGNAVLVDRGLIELDVGDWTGRKLRDLARLKAWRSVQRYPSGFTFPNGESFTEMASRITTTLRRLASAHPGQTIVAVSHADPIRAAVSEAMGAHLDLFQRVMVGPCSISSLVFTDSGPMVGSVNTGSGPTGGRE